MDTSFTPAGLSTEYVVYKSRGFWYFDFDGCCMERRSTAKGAVAAAYADAKFRANLAKGIKPAWMVRSDEIIAAVAAAEVADAIDRERLQLSGGR
jgi:hypothetical protein